MPADVSAAFARAAAVPRPARPEAPAARKNVFEVWNTLAAKFPELYPFATATKAARATEEKLLLMLKTDKSGLGAMFAKWLEDDGADSIEKALENWWKEVAE